MSEEPKVSKRVLSFGGGVQTGALLAMILDGEFARPDLVIFADPGWESKETYDFIKFSKAECEKAGLPFLQASKGNIRKDMLTIGKRFASMPFHLKSIDGQRQGMSRRQCTREYKVDTINRAIKEYFGFKKGLQVKPPIENWLGISLDEVIRMKESRVASFVIRWPLIEMKKTRQDCLDYLAKKGWRKVAKSACIGCPYHNDDFWKAMKKDSPEEFEDACSFDDAIRSEKYRAHLKLKHLPYLYGGRVPLREANFGEDQDDLFNNECEGHCGL